MKMLVREITEQAKLFLTDAGEFYPFGSTIKSDGTLATLGVWLGRDFEESVEILDRLENEIRKQLKEKESIVAAIGLDVLHQPVGATKKTDALKIMVLTNEGYSRDYFVPYRRDDEQIIFESPMISEGTLKLE